MENHYDVEVNTRVLKCPLTIPRCSIAVCRDYGNIQNGFRNLSGTTQGSVVTFGCQAGFTLVGNKALTCGSSGLWVGAWPECLLCKFNHCIKLAKTKLLFLICPFLKNNNTRSRIRRLHGKARKNPRLRVYIILF